MARGQIGFPHQSPEPVMSFSPKVREEALVKAARHCCVCRRYAGVAVEVHHIDPEAEGGANGIENAIALCFDCHCAAGHYNPSHPKGSKYSRSELRRHKHEWEEFVKLNGTTDSGNTSEIHTSYFICRDPRALLDIFLHRKERIPFRYDLILENFTKKIFVDVGTAMAFSPDEIYASSLLGPDGTGYFENKQEFEKEIEPYYFSGSRPIRKDDLNNGLIFSSLLSALNRIGIDISNLGTVTPDFDEGGCSSGGWFINITLRSISFLFSSVANNSDSPIILSPVVREQKTASLILIDDMGITGEDITYPSITLLPGQRLLIPETILFGPPDDFGALVSEYEDSVTLEDIDKVNVCTFPAADNIGGYIAMTPSTKLRCVYAMNKSIGIHRFNPELAYSLDSHWLGACCPHLFLKYDQNWSYSGEIFDESLPGIVQNHKINIGENANTIRISELEFEETRIVSLSYNGQILGENITLGRGDFVEFGLTGKGSVSVKGWYVGGTPKPLWSKGKSQQRGVISQHLRLLRSKPSSQPSKMEKLGIHDYRGRQPDPTILLE